MLSSHKQYKVLKDHASLCQDETVFLISVLKNPASMQEECLVQRADGAEVWVTPEYLEPVKKVESISDDRTVNNVMRHEYRVLSDTEKIGMKRIKDYGLELFEYLDGIGDSRELSLAKTKVEEAVMWAVKHITG